MITNRIRANYGSKESREERAEINAKIKHSKNPLQHVRLARGKLVSQKGTNHWLDALNLSIHFFIFFEKKNKGLKKTKEKKEGRKKKN